MKNQDIETRGRPRNDDFVDFCELLAADFPQKEMKDAKAGEKFVVYGRLLDGDKQAYLNFRNSASLVNMKKDMNDAGFKFYVCFKNGLTYMKASKM